MKLVCNKCGGSIKVNILKEFPKQIKCTKCGNNVAFNPTFRNVCLVIDFIIRIVFTMSAYFEIKFFKQILSIENKVINELFSCTIVSIITVYLYILIVFILYKVIWKIYVRIKE